MTGPQPWQLQFPPDGWQKVLHQALADLRTNPHDHEALQAVRDANDALSVYDQGEAATPGERIRAGVTALPGGLAKVPGDIIGGVRSIAQHPGEFVKRQLTDLPVRMLLGGVSPSDVKNFAQPVAGMLTSNDPEDVVRGVGDVGAMLLPFAKTRASVGLAREVPGPTVGDVVSRGVSKGVGAVAGRVGNTVRSWLERPALQNAVMRKQLAAAEAPQGMAGRIVTQATKQRLVDHPDIQQALEDFRAGKITPEDLGTALESVQNPPPVRAQQLPVKGTAQAGAPGNPPPGNSPPLPDIEIPEQAISQTPSPRTPDPLDTPTFQRRGSVQQDAEVMQRALQRNSYSTRQMPGGKPLASARAKQASQAAEQIQNLTDEQLQQAKGLTGGNRQLMSLINRELKRRAGQ